MGIINESMATVGTTTAPPPDVAGMLQKQPQVQEDQRVQQEQQVQQDEQYQMGGPGTAEPATQQEQDEKDKVVDRGMALMFQDGAPKDAIVKYLEVYAVEDAPKAIGDYTVILVTQLDDMMNNDIPEEVILPAGGELLEQVASVADAIGFKVDQAVINSASHHMIAGLGAAYGVEPEELSAMLEGMDQNELKQIETEQGNYSRKGLEANSGSQTFFKPEGVGGSQALPEEEEGAI